MQRTKTPHLYSKRISLSPQTRRSRHHHCFKAISKLTRFRFLNLNVMLPEYGQNRIANIPINKEEPSVEGGEPTQTWTIRWVQLESNSWHWPTHFDIQTSKMVGHKNKQLSEQVLCSWVQEQRANSLWEVMGYSHRSVLPSHSLMPFLSCHWIVTFFFINSTFCHLTISYMYTTYSYSYTYTTYFLYVYNIFQVFSLLTLSSFSSLFVLLQYIHVFFELSEHSYNHSLKLSGRSLMVFCFLVGRFGLSR